MQARRALPNAIILLIILGASARSMATAHANPPAPVPVLPPPAASQAQAVVTNWDSLIAAAKLAAPASTTAEIYLRRLKGGSRAVEIQCSGGVAYAIKSLVSDRPNQSRMLFAEQVIGRLAPAVGAPVPDVALVDVSQELIDSNKPNMDHMRPGLAHGSRSLTDVSDCVGDIKHATEGNNRQRFASLAVLFGWVGAGDRQFLYADTPPRHVHSVDHGHCFPGQDNWDATKLGAEGRAQISEDLKQVCAPEDVEAAIGRLRGITDEDIANAIGAPPDEWGIADSDRRAVAEYLARRRDELLAAYPAKKDGEGKLA